MGVKRERLIMSQHNEFYLNVDGVDYRDHPNELGTECIVREYPLFGNVSGQAGTFLTEYPIYDTGDCDTGDCVVDNAPDGYDWTTNSKYGTAYVGFEGNVRGFGCDNPFNPKVLNGVMKARSVMFEMEDIGCIDLTYNIDGNFQADSGRNFLFAGASFDCSCDPIDYCSPPAAPPPV